MRPEGGPRGERVGPRPVEQPPEPAHEEGPAAAEEN
jgi:hypothetical protein